MKKGRNTTKPPCVHRIRNKAKPTWQPSMKQPEASWPKGAYLQSQLRPTIQIYPRDSASCPKANKRPIEPCPMAIAPTLNCPKLMIPVATCPTARTQVLLTMSTLLEQTPFHCLSPLATKCTKAKMTPAKAAKVTRKDRTQPNHNKPEKFGMCGSHLITCVFSSNRGALSGSSPCGIVIP